mmetsp:Transcript_22573/g.62818  ORF Transcript_22573/g.62818 Transcript_22573/m.62818 type:complete len:175 (+) Transcript_22573:1037-1561(+)
MDYAKFVLDDFALGSLSAGRGSGDDDIHRGAWGLGITGGIVGTHASSFQPFLLLFPLGRLARRHLEDRVRRRGRGRNSLDIGMRLGDGKESRRRGDGRKCDEQDSGEIHCVCSVVSGSIVLYQVEMTSRGASDCLGGPFEHRNLFSKLPMKILRLTYFLPVGKEGKDCVKKDGD